MVVKDILRDILYRLPLQDLNNCKLINKECHSLISDPEFDSDKRRVMGDNVIFSTYAYDQAQFEVYGLRCDGSKEVLTSPFEDDPNVNMPMVLGSCNGLIGIKYDHLDYMLWNPVTQEYLSYDGKASTLLIDPTAVGLCYNASSDEYMVVLVGTLRYNFNILSCIELINFSTNNSKCLTWRTGDVAFELNGVGTVVCGVPHWVKEYDNLDNPWERKRVFFFDSNNETFSEMELPGKGIEQKRVLGLGALDGQRQLGIVLQDMKNPCLSYDVWVMKQYGNPESWTYLCKIPSLNVRDHYEYLNLVGFKPREVWMHHIFSCAESEELKLITYDLVNQLVRDVGISGDKNTIVNVTSYEPSFISPYNSIC